MVHRIRRRHLLLGAVAGAAAPLLARLWTAPGAAAPAAGGSAQAAAGTDAAAAAAPGGMGVFAVQRGLVWRSPARTAAADPADRGGIAVVRGGSRERLSVQVRLTQQNMVLPTRDFAEGWTFAPGDLVLVQVHPDQTIVEPLQRVVTGGTGTEYWAPNLTQGPRLAAVLT